MLQDISGWGLAAGWLAVAGTTLLTFGTGAQALGSLAEYRGLRRNLPATTMQVLRAELALLEDESPSLPSWWGRHRPSWLAAVTENLSFVPWMLWFILITLPGRTAELDAKGHKGAAELGRFLRQAEVWAILMIGSALALAAACTQLALA